MSKEASLLIPLIGKETVLIGYEYREARSRWQYNLLGGGVEDGEGIKDAAKRELEEEAGYTPHRLELIFKTYNYASAMDFYVFVAYDLEKCGRRLEDGENIEVKKVKLEKLEDMIRKGKIRDSVSVSSLLYFLHFVNKRIQRSGVL